jgi:hypothetical protein
MGSFAKRNRTGKKPGGSTRLKARWCGSRVGQRHGYGGRSVAGITRIAVCSLHCGTGLEGGNNAAIRLAEPACSSGNPGLKDLKL